MSKRCDNCVSYKKYDGCPSFCIHENHKGKIVQAFTVCEDYKPLEKLTTPFDGIKFYLVNACTGEIGIKYICEDCGKEMWKPYRWWMKVPYGNAVPKDIGYHFRCEECEKKAVVE